ncbi:MAG TPA: hypothetical protein VEA78_00405 [Acidimicrobiales bacterium]|nr:hypothetical protein [Acidimicrobiales bacterium]
MASLIAREQLGPLQRHVDSVHDDLVDRKAASRMRSGDHALWQDDPTEVADRLGWLHVIDDLRGADLGVGSDVKKAALLGMGGSSLFPEVLYRSCRRNDVELAVLDTTDPAAIARVDADDRLFIAASKSGTTIETTSQLAHFWEATGGNGDQFVAITDPGTPLAQLGTDRQFRRVFENRPDIGGRYSALSCFGLVPAALLGVDTDTLLADASSVDDADGVRLGAILGAAAQNGHDKLTIVLPGELDSFGLWIEQLVAESTGKHGTGLLPVVGEPLGAPDVYGDDRLFVVHDGVDTSALEAAGHPVVVLAADAALGALVMLWEQAVALSGAVLGINPFDQPDVQSAKDATNKVLDGGLPHIDTVDPEELLGTVAPGDHVCILAFVDPGDAALLDTIERARVATRNRLKVATTVGIGPRFLHSTGQLHKGGPPTGVFLQLVGDDPVDLPIPGRPYGFSTLKQAQAAGDLTALQQRGLRAGRITRNALEAMAQ